MTNEQLERHDELFDFIKDRINKDRRGILEYPAKEMDQDFIELNTLVKMKVEHLKTKNNESKF